MGKNLFQGLTLFLVCVACTAQDASLSPGAALLFKDTGSYLSNSEKNEIYNLSYFDVAKDGIQFSFIDDEGTAENPFEARVYPLDINGDGIAEVAVVFGNSFTSGMYGQSANLFIKNADGAYTNNFGFPGVLILTKSKPNTYPDILIGGPGFDPYPVWRWDGKMYGETQERLDQTKAEKLGITYIEDASASYVASLKH